MSLYDAGEGQMPEAFPTTFCSLIHADDSGSYKGAIPFVQGRFNMGGTGVLPFCSEKHKLQLVVSRVPKDVAGSNEHEWGYTLFCFFPSKQDPSWHYLVGPDKTILTAGNEPLRLVPKAGAKSTEVCAPRERKVTSGTLVTMYDFKAPRSNVCGEQFKKLEEFLLRPTLPLRIVECRQEYKANVMQVTVWDRLGRWPEKKLEDGFEDGAALSITLDNGEVVVGEVRVFRTTKGESDADPAQTGLRALINGQSHARRDTQFFKTKAVDKEHIAGSMLVTLDCTDLGQDSRNALFMSNREIFRDDPLLSELLIKLQKELHDHEGLIELNNKRYQEKIKNAVTDEQGIKALEDLLSTDPTLASLFGSSAKGKVAAPTSPNGDTGPKVKDTPPPFKGQDFPTYFRRADGATSVDVDIPHKGITRVSFLTDVRNNYFSRTKMRGVCQMVGNLQPTFSLFNGRLSFTCRANGQAVGTTLTCAATITDKKGSGPFTLNINATVAAAEEKTPKPAVPKAPKAAAAPSRPDIREVEKAEDDPPLTVERNPLNNRLQLLLNIKSKLLEEARKMRPPEEVLAVDFVFKYGLALVAMALLDAVTKTDEWEANESECRARIQATAAGMARVIVPLCLSLPKKLPKPADA